MRVTVLVETAFQVEPEPGGGYVVGNGVYLQNNRFAYFIRKLFQDAAAVTFSAAVAADGKVLYVDVDIKLPIRYEPYKTPVLYVSYQMIMRRCEGCLLLQEGPLFKQRETTLVQLPELFV